jgi:hypothetical protein
VAENFESQNLASSSYRLHLLPMTFRNWDVNMATLSSIYGFSLLNPQRIHNMTGITTNFFLHYDIGLFF